MEHRIKQKAKSMVFFISFSLFAVFSV